LVAWTAAAGGFATLVSDPQIIRGLGEAGFNGPTAIQDEVGPMLKTPGATVLLEAPSARGKTTASLIAIAGVVQPGKRELQAIYFAPTHDLANQAFDEFVHITKHSGISAGKRHELAQVIFTTPAGFGTTSMKATVGLVVLDEVDALLDPKRNHRLFVQPLFELGLNFSCVAVQNTSVDAPFAGLRPEFEYVTDPGTPDVKFFSTRPKTPSEFEAVLAGLCASTEQVMIFSQDGATMAIPGVTSRCFAGGTRGASSPTALQEFAAGKFKALFTSDALSRGLKCPGLGVVVQLDLPELWERTRRVGVDANCFCQRAWRAARLPPAKAGVCVSIVVSDEDAAALTELAATLKVTITELTPGSIAAALA
jgi:hypothetical protein